MAGVVVLILVALFVAPLVLGAYAVVQKFTDSAQVMYFRVITAGFVLIMLIGAAVILLNPV
jgi:hypothetical protein